MKRKGLFRSVIAMVLAITMVCTELPVMPDAITKVYADEEEGTNTASETAVDLATKYYGYIENDYPYLGKYKSGVDTIVLSSYESQRGDIVLEWPGAAKGFSLEIVAAAPARCPPAENPAATI